MISINLFLLTIPAISLFESTKGQTFTTEKPFMAPYQVRLENRRKHIGVQTPNDRAHRGERVELDAERNQANRVLAHLPNHRTPMIAAAKDNTANAVFSSKGRASGRLLPGAGGSVDAGPHRAIMRNSGGSNGQKYANFTLNRNIDLNTGGEGNRGTDRFWANGTRNGIMKNFGIDPVKQNRRDGEGVLYVQDKRSRNEEYFLYEIADKGNGAVDATIGEPENNENQPSGLLGNLFRQRATKYKCEARRVGESQCFDQNGRGVGKVNVNDKGEAIVFSKYGIPVYRGRVQKAGNRRYISFVNDGVLQAEVKHFEEKDCIRDLGGTPGKYNIKLQQPLTFSYPQSRTANGDTAIRWPDCFDISGNVQLGPGVEPSRMAFEWIVNIRPVGRLRCIDPGTCKKDCYYCNACSASKHKLDILDNGDSNICQAKGNGNYQLKVKICPPPEVFNWALCSKFTKFATDEYWKKKGDLDVQLRIWLRPPNEEEKAKEFHKIMDGPLGSVRRLGFIADYAKDEGLQQVNLNPTNQELKEWFIQKNSQGDDIAVCRNAIVQYGLGGQKVDTSFMLEAVGAAASFPDIISRTQCPKWQELQNKQYQVDRQELNKDTNQGGSGGSNPFGGLFGNLFGNRRGRGNFRG